MPKEIIMPLLGFSMEEGKIMQWLKEEGDPLEKGDPLLIIETDKASLEAESHYRGTLYKILVQEGESAPVGAPIALYLEPGEEPGDVPDEPEAVAGPAPAGEDAPAVPAALPQQSKGDRIFASPLARKKARENAVDLRSLRGSGPGGRIVAADVPDGAEPVRRSGDKVVPYAGVRKAIGDKTQLSKNTAPHYYMCIEIDMGAAMAFREQVARRRKFSLNHILIKAVAMALKDNPQLNSTIVGETITYHGDINVGFVVATDEGMQIPVVRRASEKSLTVLAEEADALTERVRQGRMQVADTQEGTFTISNLGMYGITEFTAVIHQPQTAILAVGAVRDNVLKVTLSLDHRVIDGVSAARFLATLKEYLENPCTMLI